MWSDGEPIDPSPTIDQAVNGGFPSLDIQCSRCKTPSDVDLAAMKRSPTTFVHDLAGRLRCRNALRRADGRRRRCYNWLGLKGLMDATKKRVEKLQVKGKSVDFKKLLRMEPDSGTTNIRNVKSKHWTRWLAPEHRCVVPFNSFSEFNRRLVALDETRPLACFPGIWTHWTSVRRSKKERPPTISTHSSRPSRTQRSAPSTPRRCR
jgi:hypothetical protein